MPRKATIVMPAKAVLSERGHPGDLGGINYALGSRFGGNDAKGRVMIENVKGSNSIHFILTILFLNLCWVVSAHSQSPGIFTKARRSPFSPVLRREAERI